MKKTTYKYQTHWIWNAAPHIERATGKIGKSNLLWPTKYAKAVSMSHVINRGSVVGMLPIIIILLAADFALTTVAQEKPNNPQTPYEPRSAPGAGQKFLEKFVGDWEVEKIFHTRSGDPRVTKGECHQTMINDGRFLKSEFVFYNGQTNITGIGLTGFEPATGLFTSVWADSRSTKMSFRQSKEPFDGNDIILFSASVGDGVREARPSRDVTRLVENDRKIIHQQFALNPDNTERLMLELIMTKKNP